MTELDLHRLSVFISHSDKDTDFAAKFKTCFERYLGFDAFYSSSDIPMSEDWVAEIIGPLLKCDVFVFLCSENSKASMFVNQEIGLALGWKKKIIPIKIDSTNPFGFLLTTQACKLSTAGTDIEKNFPIDNGFLVTVTEIADYLTSSKCGKRYKLKVIESLIFALEASLSWKTSMITGSILSAAARKLPLTPSLAGYLKEIIEINPQVKGSYAYTDLSRLITSTLT